MESQADTLEFTPERSRPSKSVLISGRRLSHTRHGFRRIRKLTGFTERPLKSLQTSLYALTRVRQKQRRSSGVQHIRSWRDRTTLRSCMTSPVCTRSLSTRLPRERATLFLKSAAGRGCVRKERREYETEGTSAGCVEKRSPTRGLCSP